MPDEQVEVQEQQQPDISTQLQQAVWEGTPPQQEQAQQTQKEPIKQESNEEILDPKDWLKRELDVDDINLIKTEREEYRKLKETSEKPFELKFANDASKKLYEALVNGKEDEVYEILDQKKKIASSDKMNAADAIKLNIALKNRHYSSDDVNDIFQEQYTHPKKPTQSDVETDEDYKVRVDEWQSQVERVNRKIERDAKDAKLELGKMTTELVYPDIPKKETPQTAQPSEEDLAKAKQYMDTFLKSASDSVNNFNGFTAAVKDKDVDFAVSYVNSKEEKDFISKQISLFAEKNYTADAILAHRWVSEDGTLKTDQMAEDLSLIFFGKQALQKIGVDAAGKRMEEYLKEKKKINLDKSSGGDFNPTDNKTESQQLQDFFWGKN